MFENKISDIKRIYKTYFFFFFLYESNLNKKTSYHLTDEIFYILKSVLNYGNGRVLISIYQFIIHITKFKHIFSHTQRGIHVTVVTLLNLF